MLLALQIEVIGLNRQDYETRRVLLTLDIQVKEKMARHEVELKIDNLNVEDLLDEHKLVVRLGSSMPFSLELKRLLQYDLQGALDPSP
ncbi:hypothetical protein HF086_008180 [Spodoptera exigua]|uniref:Uncharacterized protein n=1 Tax=Spodoptera exigua TaxID=7107 RepID=A0A922M4U5_SPOEX|nr:hypothetical protein HF086_008180 [Spodoptera exigua]